jgi:hypothetical protein
LLHHTLIRLPAVAALPSVASFDLSIAGIPQHRVIARSGSMLWACLGNRESHVCT